ncbi:MAG: proline--tRNA ligase [Nanoarchaeota archaeon]
MAKENQDGLTVKKEEKTIEHPEALRARKEDFSEWYNQIIAVAGILDKRYDVKGMYVWMPYGYEIMLNLKRYWDTLYKEAGIQEMYFPLIVPEHYAGMNKKWFEGFRDEAFWVGGKDEKKLTHILRPTGEPAMYPMFKLWIRTYTDLPLRIYETVSSFRYETKHTRPIIRDREITMWFEIHTAHATQQEAEKEAALHQELYAHIWEYLALPYIRVRKPQWECFPGALGAIEDYTIMPTGKAMENGSINMLGQAYAQAFDIRFKDERGKEDHVWQVCTGNGARYLAAVIATHGDDKGLILPPTIAPLQTVIVPIYTKETKEKIEKKIDELVNILRKSTVRVHADLREETPGRKFYNWELKGVPLRLEIGPRDLEKKQVVLVRRDTGEKIAVAEKDIEKKIPALLEEIQKNLYKRAKEHFDNHLVFVQDLKKISAAVDSGKVIQVLWCGAEQCYKTIKKQGEGIDPFGTDANLVKKGKCIVCNQPSEELLYISNTY